MNPNTQSRLKLKWMPSLIALVVLSMMAAMVEPAAFARSGDEALKTEQDGAERVVAKPLPNRPVIVATMVAAFPQQLQTRALPVPTTRPATAQDPPKSTGKSRKWILIIAAAGAGAVTAAVLARRGDKPEETTITVGSPTVGGPQ